MLRLRNKSAVLLSLISTTILSFIFFSPSSLQNSLLWGIDKYGVDKKQVLVGRTFRNFVDSNYSSDEVSSTACQVPLSTSSQFGPSLLSSAPEQQQPQQQQQIFLLEIGYDDDYGRFGNQLIEISNAILYARELSHFLSNRTVWIGLRGKIKRVWVDQIFTNSHTLLRYGLPVVAYDDFYRKSYIHPVNLQAKLKELYYSESTRSSPIMTNNQTNSLRWDIRRRLHVTVFSHIIKTHCQRLAQLRNLLQQRFNTTHYIAVHVRGFEGGCLHFADGTEMGRAACDMSPWYVLSKLQNATRHQQDNFPIVVISDMQNKTKLRILREAIPRRVVIPAWDLNAVGASTQRVWNFRHPRPDFLGDLAIASSSDFFLGNRASTFAISVGIARRLLFGFAPETNLFPIRFGP